MVTATPSPLGGESVFFESVAYGSAERQQLDILLPAGDASKGVLLFFHGGGFTAGDKSNAYDEFLLETMQTLLENDIAIVSANYTLLTTTGNEGVLSALEDGETALNYLRSKLNLLEIPSGKVVLAGVSAGAGIAQWNGFQTLTITECKASWPLLLKAPTTSTNGKMSSQAFPWMHCGS